MENKKPKIFVSEINKKLNNNETYAISSNEERKVKKDNIDVQRKINDIFTSSRYVYKANVLITFSDHQTTKKIIGKNEKSLITIDNELIPISDIIDIDYKD